MKINLHVEEKTDLYQEKDVQGMLDRLNFFLIQPEEATITLKKGFVMIDIIMTNGEKIKYTLQEKINRKIFHFGNFVDEAYPYTEKEDMHGALSGYTRIYPYYVEREFYIGRQKYVENPKGEIGHYLRDALQDKYRTKLGVK